MIITPEQAKPIVRFVLAFAGNEHDENVRVNGMDAENIARCAEALSRADLRDESADPKERALDFTWCTCEEGRSGCMDCWHRGESLIGARIRDAHGREWTVDHVDEKDDSITLGGERYWMHFWDFEGGGAEILSMPEPEEATA